MYQRIETVLTVLLCVFVAACDLGVTNPGPIADDDLNHELAVEPLVIGMGADLSAELDNIGYFMGIASGDIRHTGAFEAEIFMQQGQIEPRHVNARWSNLHRARWVAETGIERMREVLQGSFESNPHVAEAYIWAGLSNRVLGENMCVAIIDGGEPQDHSVHFERAEAAFNEAIRLAEGQGESELLQIAYGGRAQVRAALGSWEEAAADAGMVSDDALWEALYSENSSRENNWLANESHIRRYFSVYDTWVTEVEDDPRAPWEQMDGVGVDGVTPFWIQLKYPSWDSDIDLVRGDEMRLIEAEAALRLQDDVNTVVEKINGVRAAAGVEPISAADPAEAWQVLRREREIVLWMEGRRLWDLRRFDHPFLGGWDRCIPISENEMNTNTNLR